MRHGYSRMYMQPHSKYPQQPISKTSALQPRSFCLNCPQVKALNVDARLLYHLRGGGQQIAICRGPTLQGHIGDYMRHPS